MIRGYLSEVTGELSPDEVVAELDARRRIEIFSTLDVVRLDVEDVLAAVDQSPYGRAAAAFRRRRR